MQMSRTDDYEIEVDREGKLWFAPNGDWKEEYNSIVKQRGITCVKMSHTRGWRAKDLSFLVPLEKTLEHLRLLAWTLDDASQISNMINLRSLLLSGGIRKTVDFSKLSELEKCDMGWPQGAETIFECSKLKELYIKEFPGTKLEGFKKLGKLRTLDLRDFRNLTEFPDLNDVIGLDSLLLGAMRKLPTVEGLGHLRNLRRLDLSLSKKIEDLSPIFPLTQLKILALDDLGDVATLKPLGEFKKLDFLSFVGTYPKDGDLSFLDSMKHLKALQFENKRQFNRKREVFPAFHNQWDRTTELA